MSTPQARKRSQTKSIEKRQRILDATAKMIARNGTTNITLHDVGGEVGMYAASIYYYFASREELIKEVHLAALTRLREKVAAAVAAQPPGSSPLDRLRQAILVTIGLNSTTDDYVLAYTRVFDRAVAPEDREIRQNRKAIRNLWLQLLKDAQDAGQLSASADISLLRFFLIGSMHWVSYWYNANGPSTANEIADAFFNFLIEGAGASQPRSA